MAQLQRLRCEKFENWKSLPPPLRGYIYYTFSLPAKSTRYNFPVSLVSDIVFSCFTLIRNRLWLLELCSFMSGIFELDINFYHASVSWRHDAFFDHREMHVRQTRQLFYFNFNLFLCLCPIFCIFRFNLLFSAKITADPHIKINMHAFA